VHNRNLRSLIIVADDSGFDRTRHMRVLAIACLDVVLSLPVGLVSVILALAASPLLVFWPGWAPVHDGWEPVLTPALEWRNNTWVQFHVLWNEWVNVMLGLAIVALFGTADEARHAYWAAGHAVGGWIKLLQRRDGMAGKTRRRFLNAHSDVRPYQI
jgi:hypothetical protein